MIISISDFDVYLSSLENRPNCVKNSDTNHLNTGNDNNIFSLSGTRVYCDSNDNHDLYYLSMLKSRDDSSNDNEFF